MAESHAGILSYLNDVSNGSSWCTFNVHLGPGGVPRGWGEGLLEPGVRSRDARLACGELLGLQRGRSLGVSQGGHDWRSDRGRGGVVLWDLEKRGWGWGGGGGDKSRNNHKKCSNSKACK